MKSNFMRASDASKIAVVSLSLSLGVVVLQGCFLLKRKSADNTAKVRAAETESTDENEIAQSREAFEVAVNTYYANGERTAVSPKPEVAGEWGVVKQTARMQAIHMAMFPSAPDANGNPTSAEVLVVNGSSNRNNANPNRYADVDNAGVYDPKTNSFARVPAAPQPGVDKEGIDLFCSGHLQTFAGDVLFAGGTKSYNPGFTGIRALWLWDWKLRAFTDAGREMLDGRWYPTLVPTGDGRIVILGGMSDRRPDEISRVIEAYDPVPAISTIKQYPQPGDGFANGLVAGRFGYMGGQWDMYPRLIPTREGRYLMTGDGSGAGNRNTRNTIFMSFSGAEGNLTVNFEDGPSRGGARNVANKFYATHLFDPRPGKEDEMLVLGGQAISDVLARENDNDGGFATAEMSRYVPPGKGVAGAGGEFLFEEDFLGGNGVQRNADRSAAGGQNLDRRLNHATTYLPTGDFLVLGGGNFGYSKPKFNPILYRATEDLLPGDADRCDFGTQQGGPDRLQKSGFCRLTMNPHRFPRLYHTSALLLPDGAVLLGGGNAYRGVWDGDAPGDRELLLTEGQGLFAANPAEVHFFEVFKPPYFFSGARPRITNVSAKKLAYGEPVTLTVEGGATDAKDMKVTFVKFGSMTHGMDVGQRFANLAFTSQAGGKTLEATAPVAADRELFPPGYYMMFYVNKATGVPSEASIVQLLPERIKKAVK